MLGAIAEGNTAVPGATLERRLIGLHAAGPTPPRDAMLPPICMPAETGIYNNFIPRCKGGVGGWTLEEILNMPLLSDIKLHYSS